MENNIKEIFRIAYDVKWNDLSWEITDYEALNISTQLQRNLILKEEFERLRREAQSIAAQLAAIDIDLLRIKEVLFNKK